MYESRVERQIEAAHHNGPPESRCYTNHGHSWFITAVFQYNDEAVSNNEWGWGPDFGVIKAVIDEYDHQDLNNKLTTLPPSAENFARVIYDNLHLRTGFQPWYVEVKEGNGNSVRFSRQ